MKVLMRTGLTLLVIGLVFIAVAVPMLDATLIERKTIPLHPPDDAIWIGPFNTDTGELSVWVEDVYEGFDDGDTFDLAIAEDKDPNNDLWRNWRGPGNERVRTIEGVECELQAMFDGLQPGSYYLYYHNFGPMEDEDATVEVFVYENVTDLSTILWGVGVVCLSLGGMLALLERRRLRRTV